MFKVNNLSQLASSFQKNQNKQNDINVTKTIPQRNTLSSNLGKLLKEIVVIRIYHTRNHVNCSMILFSRTKVLYYDKAMQDNTDYSKKLNTIRSKVIAGKISTFKKLVKLKLLLMNFQNNSILFKDIKVPPMGNLTVKQQIPELTTAIT